MVRSLRVVAGWRGAEAWSPWPPRRLQAEAPAALIRRDVARTEDVGKANVLICCRPPRGRAGGCPTWRKDAPDGAGGAGAHGCGARSAAQADAVAGADV